MSRGCGEANKHGGEARGKCAVRVVSNQKQRCIYLSRELRTKDPTSRASVNLVGLRLRANTQPLSSDGPKQNAFPIFGVLILSSDHLPSSGLYIFFVPLPFALFPKTSMGGHSVPRRADSSSPLLSGLQPI